LSAWTVLAPVLLPAPSWADPVETNLTETSVTLHWLAVPAAQQYILDAINLSTGLSIGTGWIAPTGVTEFLITGLTPATGYAFHLSYQTATGTELGAGHCSAVHPHTGRLGRNRAGHERLG
jgi:hypothetical protein